MANCPLNATPDLVPKLEEIYKNTLDYLDLSKTQNLVPEILFLAQSSFCSNISTLLLKLKKNLTNNGHVIIYTYANRTLKLIYEILSNKNTYIYEEGLMAVSALVNATNSLEEDFHIDIFNQETFDKLINNFIYNGLTSMNTGVINATCLLIGNLYYFLNQSIPELLDVVPDIYNALKNIILDNKANRDVHPFILKAISDIFVSMDRFDGAIPDLENELKDLLTKIYDVSCQLDITNKDDVEYGNLFYQYLSDAFYGYAKIYYCTDNQQKEREQLFLLDKLANYIYMLSPRIDESVYLSFAKASQQFASKCSRRNNVILNRHSIHRILKQGYENSMTQDSKKKIKEVIEFLKSK